MLEYLGEILSALMSIFPRLVIVRSTHRGVRFRNGSQVLEVTPGLSVYWPLVTELEVLPIKRQTKRLAPQFLTTLDGVTLGIRGLVVYEVTDVVSLLTKCWDYEETIEDLAQAAIRNVVRGSTWEHMSNPCLENRLMNEIPDLEMYGIKVSTMTVTDLSKILPLAVFSGGNNQAD